MKDVIDYYIGISIGIAIVVIVVKVWVGPDFTVMEILRVIMSSKIWWWV
jgi:hypothetical protein